MTWIPMKGSVIGSGTPVRGFTAAAEYEDWGYFFLGASAADEWLDYGAILEEMPESVQFIE